MYIVTIYSVLCIAIILRYRALVDLAPNLKYYNPNIFQAKQGNNNFKKSQNAPEPRNNKRQGIFSHTILTDKEELINSEHLHHGPHHHAPPGHTHPHHTPPHLIPHYEQASHHESLPKNTEEESRGHQSQLPKGSSGRYLKDSKPYMILLILLIEIICTAPFVILDQKVLSTVVVFLVTIIIIFLRIGGLNEAYPATIGAIIIILTGVVSYPNLNAIVEKIGGASITIIATIVMAVVLESFGFFYWVATGLAKLSKGSGYRLFWYIQLLCFLMTLLFNNDGSILITTPILILLLKNLQLKTHQKIPYLLSGALIATASSAPIGVSNIVNLISLNIVGISLYEHTAMMFVPATIGLLFMSLLLFLLLKKSILRTLPCPECEWDNTFFRNKFNFINRKILFEGKKTRTGFMLKILMFVFSMRCALFIASYFNIPIAIVAVVGSIILLVLRWYYFRTNFIDILHKTPWHILLFAFSMYVIIYGLNNVGLTEQLVKFCRPLVSQNLFNANFIMGGLISVLSNIFNNHPALMIGTITLQSMELPRTTMKMIYLANIIGSDMGSLLLPIGTLASLLWMHILKENQIKITWGNYIRVTIVVIPLTVVFTLFLLYCWIQIIFV